MMMVLRALKTVEATETASVLVGSKEEKEAVLRQVADPADCCVMEINVYALVHLLRSRSLLYSLVRII